MQAQVEIASELPLEVSREALWNELTVDLRKFITRRVPNRADAEDVLQDALVKIHRNIDRLAIEGNIYAWVYRVTRNSIVDHYRKRQPDVSLDSSEGLPKDFAQDVLTRDVLGEIADCLRPMIARLPAKYREALVLADLEGVTQAEVAARLSLSVSGAKSRVQRAREQLKNVLFDCCQFEFDCRGKVVEYRCQNPYKCAPRA